MMKKQNGITLIALVITIIVLLILAGVSIAMLAGEGGILGKASTATENTLVSEVDEAIKLAISEILANKLDPTYPSTKTENVINETNLTTLIPANNANVSTDADAKIKITVTGTGETKAAPVTITSEIKKKTHTWTVDANGKVEYEAPTTTP